jgi:hypothetical protein
MFCCEGFENLVGCAGERGIAALVRRTPDGLKFVLQSRGVAYADEGNLRPMPIPVNVNIACSVGLSYCPYCGTRLQQLVESAPHFFGRLAEKHEKLHTVQI